MSIRPGARSLQVDAGNTYPGTGIIVERTMTTTPDYAATLEADESDPVSKRVVASVAEATGTDPLDLEPLYHSVDPDCLDRLFDSDAGALGRDGGHVQFSMAGCRVVVDADGSIDVTPLSDDAAASHAERTANPAPEVPESPD